MEEMNSNQEDAQSVIKSIMVEQEEKTRELLDPLVVVISAVNSLKDREREVLLHRFGLTDGNKMTLEAVGAKFSVTRERVRQIESAAVKKLGSKPTKDLSRLIKIINGYLIEMGGVISLDGLSEYFKLVQDQRHEAEVNALRLAMAMDDNVMSLSKATQLKVGWAKKGISEQLVKSVLVALEKILNETKQPLSEEELWNKLSNTEVYASTRGQLTPSLVAGIVRVGANMATAGAGKWGLTSWPTVVPKRIRDKIYLILQKTTKPMHFRDITDAINQTYPGKTVLSRTVHNELIGDGRFVLVGRGIYGLKDWGYQPGVVAEVMVKILKEAGRPMSVEEMVDLVAKDRQVKRNTVVANLQNKSLFKKMGKGMYTVSEG